MKTYPSAAQSWLCEIPMMQQSVLFSAIRGPDGFRKHHEAKPLLKWYRRCVLMAAFEGRVFYDPATPGGGSFTGPSVFFKIVEGQEPFFLCHDNFGYSTANTPQEFRHKTWRDAMQWHVDAFIHSRDEMGLHYFAHAAHAFEILGYKHPDHKIAEFWKAVYFRMCNALHMMPEPIEEMDRRLGDDKAEWAAKADESGSCSE